MSSAAAVPGTQTRSGWVQPYILDAVLLQIISTFVCGAVLLLAGASWP